LKCPNTKEVQVAVKLSKSNNGEIHNRKLDNIKKKMSNMIIKINGQK